MTFKPIKGLINFSKKYVNGGHGPNEFDCAGLTWYVYNEVLGINVYEDGFGRDSTTKIMTSTYGKLTIYQEGIKTLKDNEFKLGDILLFHRLSKRDNAPTPTNKYPGHCGIYIGNNETIGCNSGKGITHGHRANKYTSFIHLTAYD